MKPTLLCRSISIIKLVKKIVDYAESELSSNRLEVRRRSLSEGPADGIATVGVSVFIL